MKHVLPLLALLVPMTLGTSCQLASSKQTCPLERADFDYAKLSYLELTVRRAHVVGRGENAMRLNVHYCLRHDKDGTWTLVQRCKNYGQGVRDEFPDLAPEEVQRIVRAALGVSRVKPGVVVQQPEELTIQDVEAAESGQKSYYMMTTCTNLSEDEFCHAAEKGSAEMENLLAVFRRVTQAHGKVLELDGE